MTKNELIDLLYKAIDFINNNDKPKIASDSYYCVVPSRKESGFSNKYYIHISKLEKKGFWCCSVIAIDLDRSTISLTKDCLNDEEWLQSLFKASEVTEINNVLFTSKWNKAEEILNQMAEL